MHFAQSTCVKKTWAAQKCTVFEHATHTISPHHILAVSVPAVNSAHQFMPINLWHILNLARQHDQADQGSALCLLSNTRMHASPFPPSWLTYTQILCMRTSRSPPTAGFPSPLCPTPLVLYPPPIYKSTLCVLLFLKLLTHLVLQLLRSPKLSIDDSSSISHARRSCVCTEASPRS